MANAYSNNFKTILDNYTDFTGYMIWPASGVLAQFIAASIGSELVTKKKVIELGSGAGYYFFEYLPNYFY